MALSITECLLQSLGATADQLEANRDSIRQKVLSFEKGQALTYDMRWERR